MENEITITVSGESDSGKERIMDVIMFGLEIDGEAFQVETYEDAHKMIVRWG